VSGPHHHRPMATDLDGTITNVQFFAAQRSWGSICQPLERALDQRSPGSYVLTAVSADDTGATTLSAPVSVSVVLR